MRKTLRKGDFWRICDRSGFKYPASQMRRQWDGLIVGDDQFERRHPQEAIRVRAEKIAVKDPRPPSVPQFNGPLTTTLTAAAEAGSVVIDVETTERWYAGDKASVFLANADQFKTVIQAVESATRLRLTRPLPDAATAGAMVFNDTAIAADLGWNR